MDEVQQRALWLINAYLDHELPLEWQNAAVQAAHEYIGYSMVITDPGLSSPAFHECVACCRNAEDEVNRFYRLMHDEN